MSDNLKKQFAILQDKYVAELPKKIANICSVWEKIVEQKNIEDLSELHRMAHSLSGSGGNYNQEEVSKVAKSIENLIKNHALAFDILSDARVGEMQGYLQALKVSIKTPINDEGISENNFIDSFATTLATMKVDPMRILLADDDLDSRVQLKLFLESKGHQVFEVQDGQEAIDTFVEIMPDIVVIDVVMPTMAGYEASGIMKEKSGDKFIPIIFLTSSSDNETLARCIAAGGDDFLTKPVNPILLHTRLQSYQRIRNMYQKLNEYQCRIEEELETSKHVLESVLNKDRADISGLSCWALSPGYFSGDLHLNKVLENGHVYVLLCDFTGHGLPAAIGTIFVADLFRSMTKKSFDAEVILNEVNEKMNQILPTGRYCAAIMLDYNPALSKMKIWNCGLPTAYLLDDQSHIVKNFPSASVPLGVLSGDARCEPIEIKVNVGQSIVIFSDGITEAENPQGEMYSDQRLQHCIGSVGIGGDVFSDIKQDVELFMEGIEPTDDISLVVLNFNNFSIC